MKIGILTTGHTPDEMQELGNYEALFRKLLGGQGFDFENYNVVDGLFPDGVEAADGWLITGSKHGAYEPHDWIPPLEQFIRDAYVARVPVVGICFGHQIIAQALGGRVEKFAGGWAVGRQSYDFGGQDVALNAWHQDQVTVRPVDARVVASNAFCENAALVYDDRVFTVQAHPEFEASFIDGLIRTRGRGVVPEDQLEAATATLDEPTDNARLARQIGRFFRERSLS